MKLKHLPFFLAAATLLAACDKPKEEQQEPEKPVVVVEGKITLAVNDATVPAEGGTQAITFEATKAWTASSSESWLTIDPAKGEKGTATVTATVAANEGYDDRTATITFTCDKDSKTFTVTQKQKGALVLAPETITVPAEGGSYDISLSANVEVSVTPDADWISLVQTKALTDYTYTIAVAENEAYEPREGHVVFSSDAGSETITFQQEAAEEPAPVVEDPFDGMLETITTTTTWAGTVFDAIIDAKASGATEYTSPDGENFIDTKLGYLAGFTKGTNQETGEETTTYGKFKFKKNENAGIAKMSRVQFGGTGVVGKRNNLVFKVNGPGALTAIARSSGDAARPLMVAVNGTPITEDGYEMPGKADNAKTVSIAVEAKDGDLVYIYSGSSGINLYSLKWVPGGQPENPDTPDQPAQPADGAELDCPNPPTVGTVDMTALTGYGAGVTGGANGTVLHFNSGKALQTWLLARTKTEKSGDHSPVTIWLSGTFKPDDGRDFSSAHPWFDVKDVSNLSFIGTDSFVMNKIGIFCVRASNIVIRNINFQQPKADNGADAVSMQECDGIWVDHCTFTSLDQTKDHEDGSTDITHGSKNVTVSWCRYIKTQKSCLVGHSNSESGDTQITATFHHNWFEGSSSRHPRVRFGQVHVYNNFFDGNTTYGVGSAYGAKVLVEYNYFDGVQLPTDICTYPAKESGESNLQGSVAGYLYPTQNIYVNRPAKAKDPYPLSNVKYEKYGGAAGTELTYADFKPSYTYTVTGAEDVPAVVKAGAGYGKLGFTEAPVAVNNGGITDYDATDDNPTNPDPDEPDEPVTPVDDGAKTYTLYATGSKKVETTGGSYFDYTTDTADFRSPGEKAYNGPFTVNGTEYSFGVKMNSSGYVKFTTSSTYATTVQFWYARRNTADTTAQMQLVPTGGEAVLFDTPFDTFADSGVITLEKGTEYTIKQKAKEQGLILIIVKENE